MKCLFCVITRGDIGAALTYPLRAPQENGCYDALERQYLKTMVFGIYLDPDEPEKL